MKFIKRLLLSVLLLFIIVISVIFFMGYSMYNNAIGEASVAECIADIKSDENYVVFDDISDDFKNAIVAVEDHRFYSHTGIDFITTARSMLENIRKKDIVAGGSTISQQVRKTYVFYTRTTFF